jgi:hypothetical protein
MFRNLPPLCKFIIAAIVASAVLSIAIPSLTVSALPLYSQLAIRGLQIWRLATYPFFIMASMRGLIGSLFNLFWIGAIVAIFGGELETIIHTKRLTIALASTVIAGGILFSIMSPDGVLSGPGIITMFMLGGFAYMWPKREISIFGIFWIKAWIIALVIFIISVIPMSGMQLDTSASNLFGPFFGALGAIVFFHAMYRQYSFGRAFLNRMEDAFKGNHPPSPSLKRSGGNKTNSNDPKIVEARIDAILDKIASSGMASLSKEEREFLLTQSK